ncbi:MAG: bifunctional 3-hydroxydecanoyl-ACP dehydratase/trans-2-decenoyl-ACP isomerase [Deltaproteobacteria bacterium]|nr:bifunctional 3-hydroxydecanoyl-ACP dehydratase/trans-2-decenoyl-ACP isomerase [Deltaproteobacteria bacterium]
MTYAEFQRRTRFSSPELLAFAEGRLIADAPAGFAARLPLPPLLMLDRIVELDHEGTRGRIVAERDVHPDDWLFQRHFVDDPVQPGSLGIDAVWQLVGFFCAWRGALGVGRALGCGEVAFGGQIRPHNRMVRYDVHVRRCWTFTEGGAVLALADANVLVDDVAVYALKGARVGLFRDVDAVGRSTRVSARTAP